MDCASDNVLYVWYIYIYIYVVVVVLLVYANLGHMCVQVVCPAYNNNPVNLSCPSAETEYLHHVRRSGLVDQVAKSSTTYIYIQQ